LINQNISFDEQEPKKRLKKRWLVGVALAAALCVPATGYSQGGAAPQRATNLSGYMDFQYRKPQFQDGELDFRRFVLLVTHQFSDRIRFVSEL
jgi:hypothetical protein